MRGIASTEDPSLFLFGAIALFAREGKNVRNELACGYGSRNYHKNKARVLKRFGQSEQLYNI
jgi:hypothetical protein